MGTESLYPGEGKAAGAWLWPPTSNYNRVQEWVDIYRYSFTVPSGHVLEWSLVYLIYTEANWELCQNYVLTLQWRWCWGYRCCLKQRDMNPCFLTYIQDCAVHGGRHWKLKNFRYISGIFSEVSRVQHHTNLCSKCSNLLVPSLNLSPVCWWKVCAIIIFYVLCYC